MTQTRTNMLKQTKQRLYKRMMFGFDIETCNKNKDFLMASIVGETKPDRWGNTKTYVKIVYSREELATELETNPIYRDSDIFATNLGFDFYGSFFGTKQVAHFKTNFGMSNLIWAKTFFDGHGFTAFSRCGPVQKRKHGEKDSRGHEHKSLRFFDTKNYAPWSVEKLGKILSIPKLKKPSFLGNKPQNEEQWEELRKYNMQDAMISYQFMKFFISSIEKLGGTFKPTIASCAVALFKNKYLDRTYFVHKTNVLDDIFKSYYGGRTEVFKRGTMKNLKYYDYNSLYPSVMQKEEYPDPNSLHSTSVNKQSIIENFHGVSDVNIIIPKTKYPLLMTRINNKTVAAFGKIRGWYTHIELRAAMKMGGIITQVNKTHYYTKTCRPFTYYVDDLYALRRKYKSEKNAMENVIKLLLNSLYGKFGQKYTDRRNTIHIGAVNILEMAKWSKYERVGNYFVYTKSTTPPSFCFPIWASYITAYGRLKIHKAIVEHNAVYCDTDSIVTQDIIDTSDELGEFKLEMNIDEGTFVRPKLYTIKGDNKEIVRAKGLYQDFTNESFKKFLLNPISKGEKFLKLKEANRRNLVPNQIVEITKILNLNDDKRKWKKKNFDYELSEESEPNEVCMW